MLLELDGVTGLIVSSKVLFNQSLRALCYTICFVCFVAAQRQNLVYENFKK